MRYIQTLYFPPSTNLFKEGLGWNRPEFHLMAWTLSCLQLHSYYEDVELYTNNEGGHWLIDLLHLPYTKVHTDLNSFSLLHPKIWASSKIYTYSLQKEPFIHVDGDIFLFSKLPEELTNAPLVCQNFEIATDYYTKTQKELIKYFSYFPSAVDKDFHSGKMINAVNAGLLGGHDIDFFQEYTKEAFLYIKNNSDHFENVDMDKFNVFFEQHLFYVLAKERNIPISSLFKDMHTDNGYAYIGNIYETPYRLNYIHLMAHFKRDETTCLWMAEKLRTLYPDYFYRIVNLFKDNGQSLLSSFLEREDTHDFGCLETRTIQHFQTQRFNKNKQSGLLHQKMECELKVFCNMVELELGKLWNFKYPKMQNDYDSFISSLQHYIDCSTLPCYEYLCGRDLMAIQWLSPFIKRDGTLQNYVLSKAGGIQVIPSKYDWASLFNKYFREGIEYYEKRLDVTKTDDYYNLIVPDLNHGFLLYDIDNLANEILKYIEVPHTVSEVVTECAQYFEQEVIDNYYSQFEKYILDILERMVLAKAIITKKRQ